MPAFKLPEPKAYLPITFAERGVLVPFTTPMLAGTRARPNERSGAELLVPNLSGGRGVYVLPWSSISGICRPTVHDRRLNQKVEQLRSVTPGTIRQAAREVAIEGLAGREAQVAAARAVDLDHRARLRTNFLLLVGLLERLEPGGAALGHLTEASAELEARAYQVIAARAARFGLPPDTITTDLEQLAEVFSSLGVHGQGTAARLPALLEMLSRLREETADWARAHRFPSGGMAALIAEAAAATVTCAAATLRDAWALTRNVAELVRQWNTNPAAIVRLAARPEWLLDGWEQICLLWQEAVMPGARDAALIEMAMLAPVLPKETREWARLPVQAYGLYTYRRTVLANEDWRSAGASNELVPRNERLRARSV